MNINGCCHKMAAVKMTLEHALRSLSLVKTTSFKSGCIIFLAFVNKVIIHIWFHNSEAFLDPLSNDRIFKDFAPWTLLVNPITNQNSMQNMHTASTDRYTFSFIFLCSFRAFFPSFLFIFPVAH